MNANNSTRLLIIVGAVMLILVGCGPPMVLLMVGSTAGSYCDPSGGGVSVDPGKVPDHPVAGYGREQLINAAYIVKAGKDLGLGQRDQTIGVMTAMGESSLTVIDHGDTAGPDSRGLFQQRANGAWGSYADRMDPYTSATNFFKALKAITGRASMPPTLVAHEVQNNADPNHYTKFWDAAVAVVAALVQASGGSPPPGLPPANPGQSGYDLGPVKPQTQALADLLGKKFGVRDIGGYRPHDAYPDHPSGLAIDLMVYTDRAKGQAIADYGRQHAQQLGVQYIIWYQHIWNLDRADEGWRPMDDRGSPTANHMDHVHITLRGDATPVTEPPGGPDSPSVCQDDTSSVPVNSQGWGRPAEGPITSPYGWRIHPITGERKLHTGTDIGAGCNQPIRAANAGVVISAGAASGYGNLIIVDHGGGILTRYAHMYDNGILIRVGDHVTGGQQIAKVGSNGSSTACHLHFEVSVAGSLVNPQPFMQKVGVTL